MNTKPHMAHTVPPVVSVAARAETTFTRIAAVPVTGDMADGEGTDGKRAPEIIDGTGEGWALVYTDRLLGVAGCVETVPIGLVGRAGYWDQTRC